MIIFTKAQLATILGALDDRPRNPSNKDAALKAIAKAGKRFGLTTWDILGVAPGLLDGRMSPDAFRVELHDMADPGEGAAAGPDAGEPEGAVTTAPEAAPANTGADSATSTPTAPETEGKVPEVRLTDAQLVVLADASRRDDGSILPLPKSIKADASDRMVNALIKKGLVERVADERMAVDDLLRITRAGLLAIHADPDDGATAAADAHATESAAIPAPKATSADTGADSATPAPTGTGKRVKKTRSNTKQAAVIDLLRRGEGATIAQVAEITGWQNHTVRGFFAGALKKKLGLAVTSEKVDGIGRVYRLQAQA